MNTCKLITLFCFVILLTSSRNIQHNSTSQAELLVGSWLLHSSTRDNAESCKASSSISSDNTYTFFSNGTFEYDHGSITEDVTCKTGCCSDLVNLVGKWELLNEGKIIKITALHEKENPSNLLSVVLFYATINILEEGRLVFSQSNSETNIIHSFEFRKR